MSDLIEFFSDLFNTSLWPPRWRCGYWSDFHGWLYIASDLTIWFSYFAIPVIILSYTYQKKYQLKYTKTYFLFASFILLCGSTHLLDAAMFWSPMYRLNGLIRFITGATSLVTVWHLVRILPDAFREKTSVVLEREIAKRVEAERRLEIANEGLRSFAYMASHDLQEPVRKINLNMHRLIDSDKSVLDDASRQLVVKTMNAAGRMTQIIQGILALSSIEPEVEIGPVDLNEVVQQSLTDLEVKITETKTSVNVSKLPSVKGNREYLTQIFYNLFSNAIKFSKDQPIISVYAEQLSDKITIHVRDNGIGMREEDKQKIFDAFARLHSKADFEGSGIGLAICKKIVEALHGSISVQSQEGAGSTFSISLPAE